MDVDVLIVGAGPTGLMLAGELRLGGASVLVLERLAAPTGQSRGLGFTARALEVFDQRGLLPLFGEIEISPVGHFGGQQFDYTVLPGAHFGARGIPQWRTEAALEKWAVGLGVDIRWGWQFTAVTQDDHSVEVAVTSPDGDRRLRAAYLVGCDGGDSAVRKAAGFDFPGTPATRGMYLADVVGCDLRPRFLGERNPGGMVMAAPLGDGVDRVIVVEDGAPAPDRGEQASFSQVAEAWHRITGEDIRGGRADWVGSFTDSARQATQYRRGRVLLAGDAAHIHLPAGGQGLSTGVQDAVNLGWKLAATVGGWAPDGLLDSYHDERHAVGVRLLMNTRAQGMLFVGGPEQDPMRELFSELIAYDDVKRHLAGVVSGLDVCYPVGVGEHPLLGRRLPPLVLTAASGPLSTVKLLHPADGLLLDLADDPSLRQQAAGWLGRVKAVTAAPDRLESGHPLKGLAGVLVRPDGHVVWASTPSPSPSPTSTSTSTPSEDDGLAAALHRWFGAPAAG